jgi:hypothetical protein
MKQNSGAKNSHPFSLPYEILIPDILFEEELLQALSKPDGLTIIGKGRRNNLGFLVGT